MANPLERLRHHVTGAIERGEKEAVTEQRRTKKFCVTLAYDVPCYGTITVEADTAEEAEQLALREANSPAGAGISFDPAWDLGGELRVADWEEEKN